MLFNSYQFMVFFPIALLILFVIPKRMRRVWLLVCSLFFYACWSPKYLMLLLTSIVVTYVCGLVFDKTEHKKAVMIVGLLINFGILFFFKYFNFFVDSLNGVFSRLGNIQIDSRFDVILPVGISFYTFQAVGYMIDVYKGKIKPEKSFVRYALFVSFFPQLVAGPIERSENILNQIDEIRDKKLWDYERIKKGIHYMAWGYFLKLVVADRLSIIADEVFENYSSYGTIVLIIGAIAFSLQIYCDFASYSTIAIGSASIMGIKLMENFDTPYLSMSIKEFWRRWHISLSTWFRDYLYIPLGGSRCSRIKRYRNILITFLVSGLWHGANWTFVVWGGLHGLYQIIGDILQPIRNRINTIFHTKTESMGYKLGRIIGTFALTAFAWIFFRAESLSKALSYIMRMFTHGDLWVLTDGDIYIQGFDHVQMFVLMISLLVIIIASILRYHTSMKFDELVASQGTVFQMVVMYLLIMFIVIFGKYGPSEEMKAFLYFQF